MNSIEDECEGGEVPYVLTVLIDVQLIYEVHQGVGGSSQEGSTSICYDLTTVLTESNITSTDEDVISIQ